MPAESRDIPHDGMMLMRTIASALLDLYELPNPGTFTLPYPREAQRALDRTVLACLLRGAEPPRSVPDLLAWCRERAVIDWPISLPDDLVGPEDRLVDTTVVEPTQLCYEWAIEPADSATEQVERELVGTAIDRCRIANSPDSYSAFRRLLIERPVLTREKAAEIALTPQMHPLEGLLERIYLPAPVGWLRQRRFASCGRCRTLLVPTRDGDWWCENDRCRRHGSATVGTEYGEDDGGGVLQLTRPLRMFVTLPGQSELRLESRLRRLGLAIEMWPGYDAYDLRVSLPDGRVWAVDVKDWSNPALMGRNATPLRSEPPYDEAFLVVPDQRVKQRKNYLKTVRASLGSEARVTLQVCGESAFVTAVKAALTESTANDVAEADADA